MESKKYIKDENHIVIHGWMVNQLKLKGNELLIYALIYGFSQDEESEFYGSRNYISQWCNVSTKTVTNVLKNLTSKNLIIRTENFIENICLVSYRIKSDGKKFYGEGKNFLPPGKKFPTPREKTSPNNIVYNIEDNNINNNNIYDFIEKNFNRTLNPIEYEEISTWEDNELTRYAIKQAVLKNVYSIKYISRILYSYKTKYIETVAQAQQAEEIFKNKKTKTKHKNGWDILNEMEQKFLEEEEIEKRKKENEQNGNG